MNGCNVLASVSVLLLGSLSFGTITSFPSLAIASIQEKYPEIGEKKFEKYVTWFLNAPRLSAAIGSFLIIPILPILGRKKTLSISSFICSILWFLLFLIDVDDNKNKVHFNILNGLIVRTALGIFWGIISTLTITYITDIVPADTVGLFGSLYQLFIILGICLNNLLAAFENWKILIIVGGMIDLFLAIGLMLINDSPVSAALKSYRIKQEKKQKSRKNSNKKCCQFWSNSKGQKGKYSILANSTNLKNAISSIVIFFFQQYSGINAVLNNLSVIMKRSGLDLNANIQSFMTTMSQFLACFLACFLMDHVGPRLLWLFSCIGCLLSLALYAGCIVNDRIKSEVPSYLPVLAAFIYCLFFGLGLGPTPWIVFPREFPDFIRYECLCWMLFSHYAISFVVCYTHPIIERKIGEFYAVLIYVICSIGGCFYGAFCIPPLVEEEQDEGAML